MYNIEKSLPWPQAMWFKFI